MNKLSDHYSQYETEHLLNRSKQELTDDARLVIERILAERGVSIEIIEATRNDGHLLQSASHENRYKTRESGRLLCNAAVLAALLGSSFIFFGLLRENGSSSTIRLFLNGDADAAIFKLLGTSALFAGCTLLISIVNRRIAFTALFGSLSVLLFSSAYYAFFACLIPAAIFAIMLIAAYKLDFHKAPIPIWLAALVSIPVYLITLLLLIAPYLR